MRIGLFPLRAVLLPQTTMSLHVFEPRYREMVGRCLEHDETFGVCLILEGEEVGGPAVPRAIGTEAAIIACQRTRDGRYDLVVEGRRRFEIVSLDRSRRYLQAEVRFLGEPEGDVDDALLEAVVRLFEGVLESLEIAGHAIIDETWKDLDPIGLSYKVASALPLAEEARQELLEMPDAASRLRREAGILMSIHRIGAEAGAA